MHTYDYESKSKSDPLSLRPFAYALQERLPRLRPLLVPSLVVVTLVFAAASGLVAFELESRFVEVALGGIAFFLLALCGVEFVILALIAISSTLLDYRNLPHLFGFSSPELMVFLLLGLVLINHLSSKDSFVHTPLDCPLLVFVGAVLISFLNAKYNLGTVSAFRNVVMRVVWTYLLFFAVTNLIRTRRQLMTLVGGMLVMATITAGFMVAQQAIGSSVSILPGQKQVYNATVLGQEAVGSVRVQSGASIVFVMLLPALILHATPEYLGGYKWLSLSSVLLLPLAIAFTFSRNLWIGTVGGGLVFISLSRLEGKGVIFLVLRLVLVVVFLGSLLSAYFPRIETVAHGLWARFNSLFAGDELVYDSSTQWRLIENKWAIAKFLEYPLLGIGPGAEYRPAMRKDDMLMYFIHNAYLWILVDFGIIGFLPFFWFSVAYLWRGVSAWFKLQDPVLKSLVVGFVGSYFAMLVSCVATPKLLQLGNVSLISLILGINEVVIRLAQEYS